MPRQIEFSVNAQIFERCPDYRRAILVVTGVNNTQSSLLGDAIASAAADVKNNMTLEDRRLVAWRDAFAAFGIKVRDFKPSIDALVRRILNDKPLGSISPIVDVGTVISLRHMLPAGAHPLLADSTFVKLTLARGSEAEISDGEHTVEPVLVGEPILLDTDRIATRRWVWRQTNQSRIEASTQDFYLNIDALDTVSDTDLQSAIEEAKILIKEVFSKDCQVIILSVFNPVQVLDSVGSV